MIDPQGRYQIEASVEVSAEFYRAMNSLAWEMQRLRDELRQRQLERERWEDEGGRIIDDP